MLCREIVSICSQIHTKHINTLCQQNIKYLNVTISVHIVTTGLYSVKAPTAFRCCSTGQAVSNSSLYCAYILYCMYMQFVLCCVLQADTLQCSNCSQQTVAKCQQTIYCVIRTSLPVSSRHILTSSVTE